MPKSGYQEIFDQNILYNNRKNCKTNFFSMDRSHVYVQTSDMNSINNYKFPNWGLSCADKQGRYLLLQILHRIT